MISYSDKNLFAVANGFDKQEGNTLRDVTYSLIIDYQCFTLF